MRIRDADASIANRDGSTAAEWTCSRWKGHVAPVRSSTAIGTQIAIIGKEGLRRRSGDRATLERHLAALEAERNEQ